MNNIKKLLLILFFLILVNGLFFLKDINSYKISIKNSTTLPIKNLTLKYTNDDVIKILSKIPVDENIKFKVDTSLIKGESQILLIYNDYNDNPHEEIIDGYIEKDYTGNKKINITNINSKGELTLSIK